MLEASGWVVPPDLATEDSKTPLLTHHVIEAQGLQYANGKKIWFSASFVAFFIDISQAF